MNIFKTILKDRSLKPMLSFVLFVLVLVLLYLVYGRKLREGVWLYSRYKKYKKDRKEKKRVKEHADWIESRDPKERMGINMTPPLVRKKFPGGGSREFPQIKRFQYPRSSRIQESGDPTLFHAVYSRDFTNNPDAALTDREIRYVMMDPGGHYDMLTPGQRSKPQQVKSGGGTPDQISKPQQVTSRGGYDMLTPGQRSKPQQVTSEEPHFTDLKAPEPPSNIPNPTKSYFNTRNTITPDFLKREAPRPPPPEPTELPPPFPTKKIDSSLGDDWWSTSSL